MFELKKIKNKIKSLFYIRKLKREKKVILKNNINFRKTKFEGRNLIGKNVNIEKAFIGLGSYIGDNSNLFKCKIGRFCSIGMRVNVIIGEHPIEYVSTHPFAHSNYLKNIGFDYKNIVEKKYPTKIINNEYYVKIGNDVWIGDGVSILNGVIIGDGSIIGAGAVVTKNIEPYTIVGGVPAIEIKKRFSDKNIEKLLNYKWWNKDLSWIEKNVGKFSDIEIFFNKMNNI